MSSIEILGDVNKLNYKTLDYVILYIDYVVGLHNIYVFNYTKNVSDFLCIPDIGKWNDFLEYVFFKNCPFSRKCLRQNKQSVKF